jgi:hypothetical protein
MGRPQQGQFRRRWLVAGAVFVLVAGTGLATWQATGQRDAAPIRPATSALAGDNVAPTAIGHPGDGAVIYLVRSEEDAALIRRFASELGGSSAASGQGPASASVLVTDFDAASVAAALPDAPGKSFVDLRAP